MGEAHMKPLTALKPDGTNTGLLLLIAFALALFSILLPGRFYRFHLSQHGLSTA